MINSNPETVSTDFDISDKLYFEPLTLEDVLEIVQREQPMGVIVQLGGQTPLKLTRALEAAGVPILGTSPDAIDIAEDRRRFEADRARARHRSSRRTAPRRASTRPWRVADAHRLSRCSCGRRTCSAGARCRSSTTSRRCATTSRRRRACREERPVLIDRFLEDAFEADVDAISDGKRRRDRRRHAAHRGRRHPLRRLGVRAAAVPASASATCETMREHTVALAKALGVVGLINVQYAIKDGVGVRARGEPAREPHDPVRVQGDRRAAGVARGARDAAARRSRDIGFTEEIVPPYVSVKEAVFPFNKFREFDPILGPEMRSTGEVMGIADSFGSAFAKAQLAADNALPLEGAIFITVNDSRQADGDADRAPLPRDGLHALATEGHGAVPARRAASRSRPVLKVHEGRPNWHRPDRERRGAAADQHAVRQARAGATTTRCARRRSRNASPYTTTMSAASAACDAILALRSRTPSVRSLQEWHASCATRTSTRGDGRRGDGERRSRRDAERSSTSRRTSTTARRSATGTKVWHFCHVHARRGDRRALLPRAERGGDERHAASATT